MAFPWERGERKYRLGASRKTALHVFWRSHVRTFRSKGLNKEPNIFRTVYHHSTRQVVSYSSSQPVTVLYRCVPGTVQAGNSLPSSGKDNCLCICFHMIVFGCQEKSYCHL